MEDSTETKFKENLLSSVEPQIRDLGNDIKQTAKKEKALARMTLEKFNELEHKLNEQEEFLKIIKKKQERFFFLAPFYFFSDIGNGILSTFVLALTILTAWIPPPVKYLLPKRITAGENQK